MAQQQHEPAKIKLGALELGRFIAAVMVMLSHAVPYVNRHAASPAGQVFNAMAFPGSLGVQFFFVLSGFVMASSHHKDFGKLSAVPRFWWRRACRIYPAYWLALLIPIYYLYRGMHLGQSLHLALLDPWAGNDFIEFIPATWTLRFELAFYVMFGLCLLPYIGKPLLALWVGLTVWHCIDPTAQLLHPPYTMPFYWFIHYNAARFVSFMEFYFFAGLAAGFAYAKLRLSRRVSMALMAVSLITFLAMLPTEDWGRNYSSMPGFMLGMAAVIAANILGLAALERSGTIRLGKYALWAGAMSYPIYIFHEPILLLINNNIPLGQYQLPALYACLLATIVTILTATALVTFLYDQPIQRLLRRAGRRKKGQGALPPGPPLGLRPRPH